MTVSLDPFAVVRSHAQSTHTHHRQQFAVLTAIEETLNNLNIEKTPGAYTTALFRALEDIHSNPQQSAATHAFMDAVVHLLVMVMSQCPVNVFISAQSAMQRCLLASVGWCSQLPSSIPTTATFRGLITLMERLLSTLEAPHYWQASSEAIALLTACLVPLALHDERPKVRKSANDSLRRLLLSQTAHPAASWVTRVCVESLAQLQQKKRQKSNDTDNVASHVCNTVKSIVSTLSNEQIESLMQQAVPLLRTANVALSHGVYQLFQAVLSSPAVSSSLTQRLAQQLLQLMPSEDLNGLLDAWCSAMQHGCAGMNEEALTLILPPFWTSLFQFCSSQRKETRELVLKCLIETSSHLQKLQSNESVVQQIVDVLQASFTWKNQAAMNGLLELTAAVYTALGPMSVQVMQAMTRLLDQLYKEISPVISKDSLDNAMVAAASSCGAEFILTLLPLQLQSPSEARLWLLPILKRAQHPQMHLSTFLTKILPELDWMQEKIAAYQEQGKTMDAQVHETVYLQLWHLFPCFCMNAVDIESCFDSLAKRIGQNLQSHVTLRPIMIQALLYLLSSTSIPAREKLSQYAKHFLPLCFNVFAALQNEQRETLLPVIERFAQLAPTELVNQLFKSILKKLLQQQSDVHQQQQQQWMLLSLASALIESLAVESLDALIRFVQPLIQQQQVDVSLQKKAYKCLTLIVTKNENYAPSLRQLMQETMWIVVPGAQKARLHLMSALIKVNDSTDSTFLTEMLPEVIVSTKSVNEKARLAAFEVLLVMAERVSGLNGNNDDSVQKDEENEDENDSVESSDNEDEQMQEQSDVASAPLMDFCQRVAAGLAATSPQMISAALICLARLLFAYSRHLSTSFKQELLASALLFQETKNREIVKSCLGLVKVSLCVQSIATEQLTELMKALAHWMHSQPGLRLKMKLLLERLMRRFGKESIITASKDEELKKWLNSIMKQKEKKKKSVKNVVNKNAFDRLLDEEEEEETTQKTAQPKASVAAACLQERDNEMNLLDTQGVVSHWTVANKKKNIATQKSPADFKISEDGRLLIEEEKKLDSSSAQERDHYRELMESKESYYRTPRGQVKFNKHGKAAEDEEMSEDDATDVKKQSKKVEKSKSVDSKYSGKSFQSSRGKGDVKRKDSAFEPFAYLPLQPKQVSRRKKVRGAFDSIVKKGDKKMSRRL